MQVIPRDLIRCPGCKADTVVVAGDSAMCPSSGRHFPVQGGVPDMSPNLVVPRTVAQRTMEAPPVVRVYESRLWRRHPLLEFALGIRFAREIETIFRAARLPEEGRLLDVACGPGIYTRPLARMLPRGLVVGLDLSRPMLAHAVRLAAAEGVANAVFLRGNAMDLPFFDASFDAVNCCGALHLFPDPEQAVREVARVLTPGGSYTVAMARVPEMPLAGPVHTFLDRGVGVRALSRDQLAGLFAAAGLTGVVCHHEKAFWLIMSARKPQ